jgi:hypothetical protein
VDGVGAKKTARNGKGKTVQKASSSNGGASKKGSKGSSSSAASAAAATAMTQQHDVEMGDGTKAVQMSSSICSFRCDSVANSAKELLSCGGGRGACRYHFHAGCASTYFAAKKGDSTVHSDRLCRKCIDRVLSTT